MRLHELTRTPGSRRSAKRIGRGMGSGNGKTSGKGHKGQMARKGHKHKHGFEGGQMPLMRRIPKRGFTNFTRQTMHPVNVGQLERFDEGSEVSLELMRQNGLANGPADGIKILGVGELSRKLVVKAHAFSATAREKIEAAGGSCEVVKH